jgi:hypothetical protein
MTVNAMQSRETKERHYMCGRRVQSITEQAVPASNFHLSTDLIVMSERCILEEVRGLVLS